MNKWINRLVEHAHEKTDAGEHGYKTYETPIETPENDRQDSFVGFVGDFSGPRLENTEDAESLIERSAIREHDAGFDRDSANMAASRAYDAARQSYEYANPDGDPAMVEGLYAAYLQDWRPDGPGDVPAVPPNTNRNGNLWRQWWAKIEHITAADGRKEDKC